MTSIVNFIIIIAINSNTMPATFFLVRLLASLLFFCRERGESWGHVLKEAFEAQLSSGQENRDHHQQRPRSHLHRQNK